MPPCRVANGWLGKSRPLGRWPRFHPGHDSAGPCQQSCTCAEGTRWNGARCNRLLELTSIDIGKCTRHCDLASPETPGDGFQACSTGFVNAGLAPLQCVLLEPVDGLPPDTDCAVAGNSPESGPCLTARDCQPGLFCGDGSCRRWCRVGVDACDAGFSCSSFTPPLVVGDEEYGACEVE